MARTLVNSLLSLGSKLLTTIHSSPLPFPSSSTSEDTNLRLLEELQQLRPILDTIRSVLADAEGKEVKDESVRLWLRELKEVAYEADDLLDELDYEALRARVESRAAASSSKKRKRSEVSITVPSGVCARIIKIRSKLLEISIDRERLRLKEEYGARVLPDEVSLSSENAGSLVAASSVFGREDDQENLIQLLLTDDQPRSNLSVLAIVGVGGLGKTTLAQLVYQEPRVCKHFNLRAWVSVTADFNPARVLKATAESIMARPCELTELNELQQMLRGDVEGERLLLVLDNVWNLDKVDWEAFVAPFASAERAAIILTLRNDLMPQVMETASSYYLNYLPEDPSWLLFHHYAFQGKDLLNSQENLTEIGKRIVEKCGGLPLAIRTIGSLLGIRSSDSLLQSESDIEANWLQVLESDMWELDENKELLNALKLSYYHMPGYLRPCYLYCSTFPKGFEFVRERLVDLWIAQGYIPWVEGSRMEYIGSQYLDELHQRSFLDIYEDVGVKKLTIHDSIHDLAEYISSKDHRAIENIEVCDISDDFHHLYIDGTEKVVESISFSKPSSQRTLLLYSEVTKCPAMLDNLPRLRTLELNCRDILELPHSIGKLKHLRYLKVTSRNITNLPDSLCQLYNLQTLFLPSCENLRELPKDIGNMINLRYLNVTFNDVITCLPESCSHLHKLERLDLSSCKNISHLPSYVVNFSNLYELQIDCCGIIWLPREIGQLVNLEKIRATRVQVRRESLGVLRDLTKLSGRVCILGLQNVSSLQDASALNLENKSHLRRLALAWDDDYDSCFEKEDVYSSDHLHLKIRAGKLNKKSIMVDVEMVEDILNCLRPHKSLIELSVSSYDGHVFPSWVGHPSFSKLTNVHLCNCSTTNLPMLGQLPSLVSLVLEEFSSVKVVGEEFCRGKAAAAEILSTTPGFPSLKELVFEAISEWEEWVGIQEGDFPCLTDLTIRECPRLRRLPVLPSVQSLTLSASDDLRILILDQNLRILAISDCLNIRELVHLQHLTSLKKLNLAGCPELELLPDVCLLSIPEDVTIVDCPKLEDWCHRHKYNYIQGISELEELTVSEIQTITKPGADRFSSLEKLCIENCSDLSSRIEDWFPATVESLHFRFCSFPGELRLHVDLHKLTSLILSNCKNLMWIIYLHCLVSLKVLHVENCPDVNFAEDELLPYGLQSFKVESCEKLKTLPILNENILELTDLKIHKCPKLKKVVGLTNLINMKSLSVSHCPELQVYPDEELSSIPEHLEISDSPKMMEA